MAYTDDQMGPRRRALVGSLAGNTGVSGAMPGGVGVPPISGESAPSGFGGAMGGIVDAAAKLAPGGSLAKPADASGPVDYSKAGQWAPGHGSGYDPAKIADATRGDSGKYMLGRVASHFDANKGITQEMMDAINAQGKGHFRQLDEDEVVLDDAGADKSFGRTRHFDLIPDFDNKNINHNWGYYQQDKGGVMQGQAAPRAANPMFAGSTIGAPLQGDAQGNIQAALQGMSAQNQPSRIQQLIAALQGGGQ